MYSENLDKDLIAFTQNPFTNVSYLKRKLRPLSIKSRFFWRFKYLRHFVKKGELKIIFYREVINLLEEHVNIEKLSETENISSSDSERVIEVVKKFFRLHTPLLEEYRDNKKISNVIKELLDLALLVKVGYQNDRICEAFKLNSKYQVNFLLESRIWLSFYLSELCFLIENNKLVVQYYYDSFYLVTTDSFNEIIMRYWFSETMEYSSNDADLKTLHQIGLQSNINFLIYDKSYMESVTLLILDKALSLRDDYLSEQYKNSEGYLLLKEIVAFSTLIEVYNLKGLGELPKCSVKECKYISERSLYYLDSAIRYNDSNLVLGDLIHKNENCYFRGDLNFKYGLKLLIDRVFRLSFSTERERNWGQLLGDEFEKNYILKYINNAKLKKFKAFPGIKWKSKEKIEKYDIDLIIYDDEIKHYYFVQVKYISSKLPKYFTEQYQLYSGSKIQNGIRQLKAFKKNLFSSEIIRDKLLSRGIKNISTTNYSLLFVHNLPFLSFYEEDEIIFYEWNMFRGVLNGGEVITFKDNERTVNYVNTKADFSNPDVIIKEYIEDDNIGPGLLNNRDVFLSSRCHLTLGNHYVVVK